MNGTERRLGVLRPFAIRDFRLLWTGMTVSLIGDGIFIVAMAWQVYELSNSPAALEGYLGLSGALNKGALPAPTRERIALAVAEINGCNYCLSAHTYLGKNLARLDDAERVAAADIEIDAARPHRARRRPRPVDRIAPETGVGERRQRHRRMETRIPPASPHPRLPARPHGSILVRLVGASASALDYADRWHRVGWAGHSGHFHDGPDVFDRCFRDSRCFC